MLTRKLVGSLGLLLATAAVPVHSFPDAMKSPFYFLQREAKSARTWGGIEPAPRLRSYASYGRYDRYDRPDHLSYSSWRQIESAVIRASRETNINPNIIYALIERESQFDVGAVSSSGALGLMQVMPATGSWVCGMSPSQLRRVGPNVACGSRYLRDMLARFGSIELALLAYNAGPGAVQRAIQSIGTRDPERLNHVLGGRTRSYVYPILAEAR